MSNQYNQYIQYTEYYLISGAYQVINVVNDILTYSASCSDNFKGYLHSKVVSKEVRLNELSRYNCRQQSIYDNDNKKNSNGNDDDLDEDGFVVIKMRKPRTKVIKTTNEELLTKMNTTENEINNVKVKDSAIDDAIIKEIMEEMMSRF
jgi:hypothetical protein